MCLQILRIDRQGSKDVSVETILLIEREGDGRRLMMGDNSEVSGEGE